MSTKIRCRSEVAKALAFWNQYVGAGVPVSLKWLRPTGQKLFSLWNGGQADWSDAAILGATGGRLSFKAPGANLPLPRYAFDVEVDEIGVKVRGDWIRVSRDGKIAPAASAKSQACGFIDPMTALSVLSVVMRICSMHADLSIPSVVDLTATSDGETLSVEFRQGPEVELAHVWTSHAKLERIELTADEGRADFSGTVFLKKQKFKFID